MLSNNMYSSPAGFMPLSPLLCDSENVNPFLKMNPNPNTVSLDKEYGTPCPSVKEEKSSNSVGSSASSSDNDAPTLPTIASNSSTARANGPTIAVDKQEMMKLIEEQTIQKQRLLRKAEQARLSRKRKKMKMQELEKESDFLRQEVKRLKTALAAQEHKMAAMATANNSFFKPTTSASEYDEMFKKLEEAMTRGKEATVATQVAYMLRSFQGTEPDAQKYLESFAARISPSLPVRFLQWILTKPDVFYKDKSGLWNSLLSEETGLSQKQMSEMMELRKICSEAPVNKEALIDQLGTHLKQQYELQSKVLEKISKILKPNQLAKFLVWVRKHGEVCIKIR